MPAAAAVTRGGVGGRIGRPEYKHLAGPLDWADSLNYSGEVSFT